jgi:hypothetical protein
LPPDQAFADHLRHRAERAGDEVEQLNLLQEAGWADKPD